MLKEYRFDIATDSSGDYDETKTQHALGELYAVKLKIGDIDGGNTLTLSYNRAPDGVSVTLLTLSGASADAVYYPREQVDSNVGAGLTLDGTEPAFDEAIVAGPLRCVVASGGDTATGTLLVYVETE